MGNSEETIERILSDVNSIASRDFVRDIEDHYAAYFDELGITVNLVELATVTEWQKLAEDLLEYLNKELPRGNDQFKWILSFWQNLRQVGLFFPGDTINDNCVENA
ncbi:hypothetical protein MCAMS1_01666 [biofilm metagenome]